VGASALILMVFLIILAMTRTIAPGASIAPEPEPGWQLDDGWPNPARGSAAAASPDAAALPLVVVVGQPRTAHPVDQPPRMTNMEEVEAILADRVPSALRESARVMMIVQVRPDGTVDPASVIAHNETHGGIVPAATEAARAMRFEPLTRQGKPDAVWVKVDVAVTP
jgi:TonB family protein